jgi:hypothetical protein
LALAAAMSPQTARPKLLAAMAAIVLLAPAPLLLANVRFYLLAIPMLGLLLAWNGQYPPFVSHGAPSPTIAP